MAAKPPCAVDGCKCNASVEVILYDVYPCERFVLFKRDFTCPFLCSVHMVENERQAKGVREPRRSPPGAGGHGQGGRRRAIDDAGADGAEPIGRPETGLIQLTAVLSDS
jgi:hypothetical protein